MNLKRKESQASLAQEVYLKLKNQIISLRFIPGESLLEENLRVDFQVSRTPVRMALCKLEQDGLVTHRPGYGYSVRDIRLHHVQHLFQIREFLEVPSAKLACQNATEEEFKDFTLFVENLDEVINQKNLELSIKMGVDFHYRIAVMGKNEILYDIIRGLNEKISMVGRIALQSEINMKQSQAEHKAIMEAIIRRDSEKAAELVKNHVSQSSKRYMHLLQSKMDILSVVPNMPMSQKER